MYYGCRTPDEYIYRDELLNHLKDKSLSKVVVSFSNSIISNEADYMTSRHPNEVVRPSIENITDAVIEHTQALKRHVNDGAYVYVCGGAGHFGKAVRESVQIISCGSAGASSQDSFGIRMLIDQKRYFEDLAD